MIAIPDWLKPWKSTPGSGVGEPFPQCGDGSVQLAPHCGDETDAGPQCGDDSVQRAEEALAALEKGWRLAAEGPHCGKPSWSKDPKELAIQFRRCLQGQRDLIGFWISRKWVKDHYPLFCQALGVVGAPAYKHFAKQLALLMPRERKEIWSGGRRIKNFTAYQVVNPDAAVVELAVEKRKRA